MFQFSSESVTCGHPDKLCDQIADAILDEIFTKDTKAHTAIEVLACTGFVQVAGEISTEDAYVPISDVVRKTISSVGYNNAELGIDGINCGVNLAINEQSKEIANSISLDGNTDFDLIGAGDQGIMFGYACNDTATAMPLPIAMANKLAQKLEQVRVEQSIKGLRPDGKTQVTVNYDIDSKPVSIEKVLVVSQTSPDLSLAKLRELVTELVIKPVFDEFGYSLPQNKDNIMVNPAGIWTIGGPASDTGLTGRKIIADTYGGVGRCGGGAFSGKDPSKVDRSASYAVRQIAKAIVDAKLAKRCEIQVSYALGLAKPLSLFVETFGTGIKSNSELQKMIHALTDLRPAAIIHNLDLLRPIYLSTATYGHFGKPEYSWENTKELVQKFTNY